MVTPWHIILLGGLRATQGGGAAQMVERFRSQKIAALFALLALFPRRAHTREELADLLWPDAAPEVGRTNLRTALASLRRQFEGPSSAPAGSVLVADGRTHVRLNPDAVTTDVARFEAALAQAARSDTPEADRVRLLSEAAALYGGPLLPGFYETWALTERDRLAEAYLDALARLVAHFERSGDFEQALGFARRAVSADPLRETAHADTIRLLLALGEGAAARRQYDDLARLLDEQLGLEPSPGVAALLSPNAAATTAPPVARPPRPEAAPAAAAPSPPPVRLPVTLSQFFGREDEVAVLDTLLRPSHDEGGARLVTLTGAGGAGKTRLSVEAARRAADAFPGGVWFVALADAREAGDVPGRVAEALGLPPATDGAPVLDAVVRAFVGAGAGAGVGSGRTLLVLDNFEQIADAAAGVVLELLARAPGLSCLVTSRHRLLLDGEREFPVAPLPTPEHPGRPERLLEFSSVQLFVNRAQSARPDFQLTERNAAPVAQLCARLEGIPLAIELAAAWSQTLTPAQMLGRLDQRFDLLVSRRRDVRGRHATLRAAITWSYELLPPDLRRFFTRLSVFRGGWTLEAAEQVTGEPRALEFLAELRERSLVVPVESRNDDLGGGGGDEEAIRFRMLESIREFADELLPDEERRETARRHARFFLELAEAVEKQPFEASWMWRLTAEHDNLRVLMAGSHADAEAARTGLRAGAALWRFWRASGHTREGLDHLARLLARPDTQDDTLLRARALRSAGTLAIGLGDYEAARGYYEPALATFRELGEATEAGRTALNLGNVSYYQGDYAAARDYYEHYLAVLRAQGDNDNVGRVLTNLGLVHQQLGEFAAADLAYRQGLDVFLRIGDQEGVANSHTNLGVTAFALGRRDESRAQFEKCLAVSREVGDKPMQAIALTNLSAVALEAGRTDDAQRLLDEADPLWQEIGDKQGVAVAANQQGLLAQERGDFARAHALHSEALTVRLRINEASAVADSLRAFALLAARRGRGERAVRLLAASDALCRSIGYRPIFGPHADEIRALAALDETAFARAWDEGLSFTPEQAADKALRDDETGASSASAALLRV